MALRYGTRLGLTISILLFATVAAMTLAVAGLLAYNLNQQYFTTGSLLHQLANQNIEYGVTLPDRVMERIDATLLVQALLTAELVALAEEEGAASPEEIRAALNRVIERSTELYGMPLINEFKITDETGRAYISTDSEDFDFTDPGVAATGEGKFTALLEPGAKPMLEDVPARSADGEAYRYVGVSGVDQPRIVQVGVEEALLRAAVSDFQVQDSLERFMLREQFNRIAIIGADGNVLAAAAPEDSDAHLDDSIVRAARNYLRSGEQGPYFMGIAKEGAVVGDLGVITRLNVSAEGGPYALFVEHRVRENVAALIRNVGVVLLVGLLMVLVGVLVALVLARGLSRPIVELTRGVQEFAKGNLNYRLYFKRNDEFKKLSQSFNAMAISLQEHMHELEQATTQRERLESEVRIASEMQRALLPLSAPRLKELEIIGWSRPSREVGGDFYDYLELDDERVGVALGDATGKGVSAALLITQCSGMLRAVAHEESEPREILRRINMVFHKRAVRTRRFVTLSFLSIDAAKGTIKYASAGHPAPLLVNGRTGRVQWLTEVAPGFPLGIMPDSMYDQAEHTLDPSDTVLIFSDGLTDALNPQDELYGEDRIAAAVRSLAARPLDALLQNLREDVERHMQGREPFDDLTLVGIRYTGAGAGVAPESEAMATPPAVPR